MYRLLVLFLICVMPFGVGASDGVGDTLNDKRVLIAQLQSEIEQLDKDILDCNKDKRTWTIATVVGGVGTVGTGVGAIVQASKLRKLKKAGAVEKKPDGAGEQTSGDAQ